MSSRPVDYGIDAPRVVRIQLVVSALLAAPALIAFARPKSRSAFGTWRARSAIAATIPLVSTGVMLWSSLVGKMRVRDRLVDALGLSGDERVLDAGCGRGLALIGCAKRLTTGEAVGIDLWDAPAARDRAVGEVARVLKPGGRIAVFDIAHTERYGEILRRSGLSVESLGRDLLWLMPCRSLLARKPRAD